MNASGRTVKRHKNEQMERLSSSLTLMVKFFIPVFWLCFFGAFTAAVWITDEDIGPLGFIGFRIGLTAFFFIGAGLFALTLMRLKRVETDGGYIYVTNYFRTARYPFRSVARIKRTDLILFSLGRARLREPGIFGRSFFFLVSRRNWDTAVQAMPEFSELVTQ